MGGKKIVCLLLLLLVMICGSSNAGKVHKVGESSGWTSLHLDYKSWTASKVFQVGDTILFEYNKEFHNVVRVTHKNFNACNSTAPYATWATGNDSFTIRRPGHYYFICSVPGHCSAGQKVDIRVLKQDRNSSGPSPSPHSSGPSSVASGPPQITMPSTQPPKKSDSSSLNTCLKLWSCVVAVFFAVFGF